MARTSLDPSSPRGVMATVAIAAMVLAAAVLAQPAQRRMMVFDDGGGPQVLHFSGAHPASLRQPDFSPRDLPIFYDELHLDGMQQVAVQMLLDAYLQAFKTLTEQSMPSLPLVFDMNPGLLGEHHPGGGHAAAGENLGGILDEALQGGPGTVDLDVEAGGDGSRAIAIAIRAGEGPAGEGFGDMETENEDAEVQVWAGTDDTEGGGGAGAVMITLDTPDGAEIPEEVIEELQKKAQELLERLNERLGEMEDEGLHPADLPAGDIEQHREAIETMRQGIEKFVKAKEDLRRDFLLQVRGALAPEQLQYWPAFERALTRIKTLPNGRLDGERTDLLRIVEQLGLDTQQQEAVAEALHEYEIALDRVLVARNEYVDEAPGKMDEAIQEGEFDKALSIVDRATRLRVAVRSVNEQYAETIATGLPAETAESFRRDVLRESYPGIYRKTAAQRTFDAVAEITGLDGDVAASIDALRDAYLIELKLANERIRETVRRHQPQETRRAMERVRDAMEEGGMMHLGVGLDPDDPVREAYERRTTLDERYMRQVHALLTPEQVEKLPVLPSQVKREPVIIRRSTE